MSEHKYQNYVEKEVAIIDGIDVSGAWNRMWEPRETTNFDFEFNLKNLEYYHKINLKIKNLTFDCYVRKSVQKKTVIFVNIDKIIVAKLIELYFSTLKNFKIVCYNKVSYK